jgi:hypothetical protein
MLVHCFEWILKFENLFPFPSSLLFLSSPAPQPSLLFRVQSASLSARSRAAAQLRLAAQPARAVAPLSLTRGARSSAASSRRCPVSDSGTSTSPAAARFGALGP